MFIHSGLSRPSLPWPLVLSAAAVLLLTTGARQTLGLYVAPLHHDLHLDLIDISLALAVGQFVWGAVQPACGYLADRYGPLPVLIAGALLMAAGFALTPFMHTTAGLILSLGILSAAGAGAGSFSILIGAIAARLEATQRHLAAGIINAGASLGQFLFAPLTAALIGSIGWAGALFTVAAIMLMSWPLAVALRSPAPAHHAHEASSVPGQSFSQVLAGALRDRSYLLLHAGFFTCGFHVAFLVTHLPTEVSLCGLQGGVAASALAIIGLSNMAGSLGVGWLAHWYRQKFLLAGVYFVRVVAIAGYLLAPHTALTFYIFAAVIGLSWLSTVPPTAGLVGKLFGTRYLATLFGLTLLSHQTGAFFGAWVGGWVLERQGSFTGMWYVDMLLALTAALLNLPIRESPLRAAAVRS